MSIACKSVVIKNGDVLLPDGCVACVDVLVSDGSIAEMGHDLAADIEIDASGCLVLPGIIDIHTHGIGYESASSDSLAEFAHIEAAFGCTTFLPTLFGPPEESAENMRRHRKTTDEFRALPQIGGFRLESPYLAHTGGGISRDLAPIDAKVTHELLEAGGGHIKIWDVSPELPGCVDLVRYLSSQGIVCSVAHTRASIDQVRAAIDAGARLVTHLFDTFQVPEMTDPGVYPAGLTDYLLVEDRVACEIVGDGTHVHELLVEKTLRCKTPNKTIFVTDSNLGAGLPPGRYVLPGGWGDAVVNGPNNGVRIPDRDMGLAGSALTPIDAFRNAIRLFHKDLATATMLCSTTPARLLGLNKGEVTVGMDADLIILDSNLNLVRTLVAGQCTGEA